MASFLINSMIAFTDDEWLLRNVETSDEIILSPTSCRLLRYLLVHQGDVVSREDIFAQVFDPFGVNVTDNNLNQHVSQIRKTLSHLGLEEQIIVTVPRVGFMVPAGVSIIITENAPIQNKLKENVVLFPQQLLSRLTLLPTGLSALLIVSLAVFFIGSHWLSMDEGIFDPASTPAMERGLEISVDGCPVSTGLTSAHHVPDIRTDVRQVLATHRLDCASYPGITIFYYRNAISKDKFRTFIMWCRQVADGIPDCHSQYTSREK